MNPTRWILVAGCAVLLSLDAWAGPSFRIRYSEDARTEPVDGRVIVVVATDDSREPRFQVSWGLGTAQVVGRTVNGWQPGEPVVIDETVVGHPLQHLGDLPEGTYHVQAILNVWETFHRADGHVVKMPADNGEGQQWSDSPGNLYSEPVEVEIGPDSMIELELTEIVPPVDPPEDTPFVRHLSMQSEMLSEFWGRPVFIRAIVVVPHGFDDAPDARYPVLYNQGHFPSRQRVLIEDPPPLDELDERSRRFFEPRIAFTKAWIEGRLPRVLIVYTQHPTPFYDDSYGVNSANTGPYGDALTQEFYPYLEKEFRAVGEPWARILFGGSTGGWMSLAQQVFYPKFFGGAWGFCPDPVDFHAFQLTDVYEDDNAFYDRGPFKQIVRGVGRSGSGHMFATTEDFSRREEVIGPRCRSGGQLDAFQATFGPVAEDGYPARLWDPLTGDIDAGVAEYWREHYDLTAILRRDWNMIGPDLVGKLHVTMGTKDTFYLDTAAHLMHEFLETTGQEGIEPAYGGTFVFGDNEPHCYTATPDEMSVEQHYLPIFVEHMLATAPEGADTRAIRVER